MLFSKVNVPIEVTYQAQSPHADPFNDVDLDVDITGAKGNGPCLRSGLGMTGSRSVPGPAAGLHARSRCSDASDAASTTRWPAHRHRL
jgi:hypothetical protein